MVDVREVLHGDAVTRDWLARLDAAGEPETAVALPPADGLPPLLLDLAVPHEDVNDLIALYPDPRTTPDVWWLLSRCTAAVVADMGDVGASPDFPPLPASLGPLARYFHVYVLLAAHPHVRAYHDAHGIPDDLSRRTLADLGRNMAVHRLRHGTGGLHVMFWLVAHFRGIIYQLGRLQFQRATLGTRTGNAVAAAGQPYGPGSPSLEVHVPEMSGPLSPAACDASFARAREFFPRHFPDETYRIATCHSWLLDRQLTGYLPPESNILRFQRRFRHAYDLDPHDDDMQRFVYGRVLPDERRPRRTTLERAVADHLRAGRHWVPAGGWLLL